MLWQTKHDKFYNKIDIEPEYAIYIFIEDHLSRLYKSNYCPYPDRFYTHFEKSTNNNGEECLIETHPFYLQLSRFQLWKNFMLEHYIPKLRENDDKNFDLVKLYFEEARRELQKRYPDIKFIIIKHPIFTYEENQKPNIYYTERWKELEKEGFIIYDINLRLNKDFRQDKYILPDRHPNENAWTVLSKQFVKDLNL